MLVKLLKDPPDYSKYGTLSSPDKNLIKNVRQSFNRLKRMTFPSNFAKLLKVLARNMLARLASLFCMYVLTLRSFRFAGCRNNPYLFGSI